ncbi:hypothetical protein [Shewanella sp. NIFS-20-20]|uniref:hypothetical protein n=1 Tax=Shewanella sp. NIFS-20-20 TaxID=2853806 RepID=UPI001C46FD94|nr:hypothetical protein [Shewanella sp. NIFS-20-20]MBV7314959.1 hypothetical protein [Shewanella sp. NIFS-20-20]
MIQTSLNEVMAYRNSAVESRFVKVYGVSDHEAHTIFASTKKWLWLCYLRRQLNIESGLTIDTPLVVIDEMWHNFILFSDDYFHFCKKYFGHYIHHMPTTKQMAESQLALMENKTPQQITQELMDKKRWQYEFVYDHLGKEEFLLWYKEYPKKYTPGSLMSLALLHVQNQQDREVHPDITLSSALTDSMLASKY